MIYIRGNLHNYDHRQTLGNPSWSCGDVLPYFKKSEHQQRGASEYHGVNGELSVTDIAAPAVTSQHFVNAAIALGYEKNPDFNGNQQEGAGLYQLTVKNGKQHSAAAAFLLAILQRPNLSITTGAFVTRLLFEGTCAVGVEYRHEGTLHQVHATQEVIVSAGAFDSPKLLLLSGIGKAEDLQALGIPVVVNLPGVGQNLRDHVLAPITYQATEDVHPVGTSSGIAEAELYLHSENNRDSVPDLQCFSGPILWAPPGSKRSGTGFFGVASLTQPQNIGSVSLRPSDPHYPLLIRLNYLQSETDVQKLGEGIKSCTKSLKLIPLMSSVFRNWLLVLICRAMRHSPLTFEKLAILCPIQSALAKWALTQWQWSIPSYGYTE